jgi:protein-disulfide isomerase
MAARDGWEQRLEVAGDAPFLAREITETDDERLALGQIDRCGERADANFRAAEILQDGDLPSARPRGRANARDRLGVFRMRAVREVQTKGVGPGVEQCRDGGGVSTRGPERREDAGSAHDRVEAYNHRMEDAKDPSTPAPPPTAAGPRLPSPVMLIGLGLVAVALLAYGQNRSVSRLDAEVEALKESQRKLAVGLGEVRSGKQPEPVYLSVANAPAMGPEQAVVTLIEFSDYECPFCIRHFQTTTPQIEENYIRTGKIRYVFRDLPIDENHPKAVRAHEAAHCADAQHKFWALHPKLFSRPGTHDLAALEAKATEAGLDLTAFRKCIADGDTTAAVRASAASAEKLGVEGTPAFFVGLRDPATDRVRLTDFLSGAQPYSVFERSLDGALAEAGKK